MTAADRPPVTDNARAEEVDERLLWLLRRAGDEWGPLGVAKTAATLAGVEWDNARADAAHVEAERRYPPSDSSTMYPLDAVRALMRGAFEDGAEWAAGRAETTTATTEDAESPTTEDMAEQFVAGAMVTGFAYSRDEARSDWNRWLAGLLARPTPTRKDLMGLGLYGKQADAVLDLLKGGTDE